MTRLASSAPDRARPRDTALRGRVARRAWIRLALALAVLGAGACRPADQLTGEALLAWIPERDDIALADGRLVWTSRSGAKLRIAGGIPGREISLEAEQVAVRAAWALLDPSFVDPLADLPSLCERSLATRTPPCDGLLRHDPLLGASVLDTGTALYGARETLRPVPDAALRDAARRAHEEARAALAEAARELEASIEASALDGASRHVLRDALRALQMSDGMEERYPAPSFVRRMVRHGWLSRVVDDPPRVEAVRAAVERAERLLLVASYERTAHGDGPPEAEDTASSGQALTRIERLVDAFGRNVTTLRAAGGVRYATRLPDPAYFTHMPRLDLVVSGPPGADPLEPELAIDGAAVYLRGLQVAGATRRAAPSDAAPEDTASSATLRFSANDVMWRSHVSPLPGDVAEEVLDGAIPPHVLIVTPHGDVRGIVTAHGEVAPARRGDTTSHEQFLAAAARALPDGAHLDLLGEYLYAYAHDSPSPLLPQLLGTPDWLGDIHQTVAQTLDTATGGMYRGDCDDLSELYQAIAARQGRLAHLIGLPEHAALAWVEDEGTKWSTYVLQTAPPLRLQAATFTESLLAAYRAFEPDAVLHEDQIAVLLRFAGENTRDRYLLGARIFTDAAYADTMLDVQADWHAFTFAPAIRKMEAIVAGEAATAADMIELASLHEQTGRSGVAADMLARAIETSSAPSQRAQLALRVAEALFDAERTAEAVATVDRLETVWLRELENAGAYTGNLRLELADLLIDRGRDPTRGIEVLAGALAEVQHEDRWYANAVERARLEAFIDVALHALHETAETEVAEGAAWKRIARTLGAWLESVAFARPRESVHVLETYASLARYREARHGVARYRARVMSASAPETSARVHDRRDAGDPAADASWASISTYYWWSAMLDLIERDVAELDRPAALALAHHLRTAKVRAEELGLDHPDTRQHVLHSEIVSAIAGRDMARLRAALASVRASGDRAEREAATVWVAELGRRLPIDELRAVLDVVRATLPPKPFLTQMAWRATVSGAPTHGILALQYAATAAAGDAAIAEELALMQRLYGGGGVEEDSAKIP